VGRRQRARRGRRYRADDHARFQRRARTEGGVSGERKPTRYDPSGKDAINSAPGSKHSATFRSHIDNQKLVTEIWEGPADGPPQTIETRYMESADLMITELRKTPGGPVFNRTALRRKPR
jgi:hypothetical protein